MNPKRAVKLIVDFAMLVLMLLALAYHLTGNLGHEITGVLLGALFVLHNLLNWRWYGALLKGKYGLHRSLNSAVNLLLAADMTILMVTGVMVSLDLFAFLKIENDFSARQVHTLAAYSGLILMSIHLGLHWDMLMNAARRALKISAPSRLRTALLRCAAAAIAIWCVKSTFDMDLWLKLFFGASFSFWDFEQSIAPFFAAWLSIMGTFISLTYYTLKESGVQERR